MFAVWDKPVAWKIMDIKKHTYIRYVAVRYRYCLGWHAANFDVSTDRGSQADSRRFSSFDLHTTTEEINSKVEVWLKEKFPRKIE